MKVRNPAIELYRCVLMFGICMLHAAITPGHGRVWLINLLCFCVDGFVFITGYFGCQFKPSKLLRLLLTGVLCAILCAKGNFNEAIKIFRDYWFLHAYILMMIFAPLIDNTLEKDLNLKIFLPILIAIFVWGFSQSLPIIGKVVPKTSGLANYSAFTLLGVYILGRLYRKLRLGRRLNTLWVVIAIFIFTILCSVGLNEYNSPTSALLAGACFYFFEKIKLNDYIAKAVLMVSPSIFAIYLLHQPGRLFSQYNFVSSCVNYGWNIYITYFLTGSIMFFGSLILDIPRRIGAKCMTSLEVGGFLSILDEF